MSRKKRSLTSDELALWKRVTETVRARAPRRPEDEAPASDANIAKLGKLGREALTRLNKPIEAPKAARPAAAASDRKPADRSSEKRVRRGKLEIGGSLDLHGHTQLSGRAALERFLLAAYRRGDRVVVVVTGKGRAGEGVLKRALPGWLAASDLRPIISGFAQAHRDHGGAGAFYVFLKRLQGE